MSAEALGELVGFAVIAVVGVVVVFAVLRSTRGKKLEMMPGEARVAEIYAETPSIKYGGFIAIGSANHGKLILTDRRLIFTNPNEQQLGFSLGPKQILTATKGTKGPMMTLDLTYTLPNGAQKRASFVQLGAIPGVKIDPTRQLPIGMFIDKLTAWRGQLAS
ncbi:MAG TPA: hypothetical protein VLB44_11730 [Kofleriaceae bacterium]|nr:hypothetical protein [Kofleriaceae bacterium]